MTSCLIIVKDKTGQSYVTGSPDESTESAAPQPTIPELPDFLEEGIKAADEAIAQKDYEGRVFNIVMVDEVEMNISTDKETSYARAFEMRYELLKKKLNCDIRIVKVDKDTFLSEARTAVGAGMYYSDIVCVPQSMIGDMHLYGILLDLNESYAEAFTSEAWYKDAKTQSSGGNSAYAVAGNGCLSPDTYSCVYFNKDLTDFYGLTEDIYKSFADGSWTWDKLAEFRSKCTDAKHSDLISVGAKSSDVLIEGMFGASGMKFFANELGTRPAAADNGDRANALVRKLKEMIGDKTQFVSGDDSWTMLAQEKVMFYIDTLDRAPLLDCNFGVVPIPKFDSAQERYYTYANGDTHMFAVLKTTENSDAVVEFLNAYNEASRVIRDAWLRDLLDFALGDANSYKAVETVFDSVTFEFGYMYSQCSIPVSESSFAALKKAVLQGYDFDYAVYAQTWKLSTDMRSLFKV